MTGRWLVAMDCDGTVDISGGPIPVRLVTDLARRHVVFVIGNPTLAQRTGLPGDQTGGKSATLERWKFLHPGLDRYIVVDDTPTQYEQGFRGWEFMLPTEFLRFLSMSDPEPTPTTSETPTNATPEPAVDAAGAMRGPPAEPAPTIESVLRKELDELKARLSDVEGHLRNKFGYRRPGE